MKKLLKKLTPAVVLFVVLFSSGAGAVVPQTAQAATNAAAQAAVNNAQAYLGSGEDGIRDDCFFSVGCEIGYLIGKLILAIRTLFAVLLKLVVQGAIWMINFGTTIVNFPVVSVGIGVTLNLVNLLFVMALIVIAFKMILGLEGHGDRTTLRNVIISAVLVNFSLLIAGVLLDISNVFTNFFIKPVTGDNIRVALNPQNFINIYKAGGSLVASDFFSWVIPAIFSTFMTGLTLIIMLAVFLTAVMRNLYVACLLVIMPLTWGFAIFPGMQKYHHEWWENFIKWGVTVLPTMTFFMYIAIVTSSQVSSAFKNDNVIGAGTGAAGSIEGIFYGVIQLLIIGGLMFAGIKIGKEAGGIGTELGFSGAKWLGGFAARASGARAGVKATSRGASNVLTMPYIRKLPGAQFLANTLSKAGGRKDDVKGSQEALYADRTDAQIKSLLKGVAPVFALDRAALFQVAAERHLLDQIPHDRLEGYINAMRTVNPGKQAKDIKELKDLLAHDPRVAGFAGMIDPKSDGTRQTAEEAIRTAFQKASNSDAAKWDVDFLNENHEHAFTAQEFLLVNNAKISAIAATGDDRKINALDRRINGLEGIQNRVAAGTANAQDTQFYNANRVNIERIINFRTRNAGLQVQGIVAAQEQGGGTSAQAPAAGAPGGAH